MSDEKPIGLTDLNSGQPSMMKAMAEQINQALAERSIRIPVKGIKHDSGKLRMGLISTRWLRGVAGVLTTGAEEYGEHNWREGIEFSRLMDAALRHLTSWNDGHDLDPDSGKSHLYHASCCLMFLSELAETRPDLDDRYKKTPHD